MAKPSFLNDLDADTRASPSSLIAAKAVPQAFSDLMPLSCFCTLRLSAPQLARPQVTLPRLHVLSKEQLEKAWWPAIFTQIHSKDGEKCIKCFQKATRPSDLLAAKAPAEAHKSTTSLSCCCTPEESPPNLSRPMILPKTSKHH